LRYPALGSRGDGKKLREGVLIALRSSFGTQFSTLNADSGNPGAASSGCSFYVQSGESVIETFKLRRETVASAPAQEFLGLGSNVGVLYYCEGF
jgi:hypothetical protein